MLRKEKDFYRFEKDNHFYALLTGCIQLGQYPSLNSIFDVSSVEFVSAIIIKIVADSSITDNVFNFSNPNQLAWNTLIKSIRVVEPKIKLVSIKDWNNIIKNIDEKNNLYMFTPLYKLQKHTEKIAPKPRNYNLLKYLDGLGKSYPVISASEIVSSLIAQMKEFVEEVRNEE